MNWALETALPIAILAFLGWFVPWAIQRRMRDTLTDLGWTLAISVVILTAVGAALFAFLYWLEGVPDEVLRRGLLRYLSLGASAALAWLPVLLITGLSLAMGIEKRKGEAMAARDPDPPDE